MEQPKYTQPPSSLSPTPIFHSYSRRCHCNFRAFAATGSFALQQHREAQLRRHSLRNQYVVVVETSAECLLTLNNSDCQSIHASRPTSRTQSNRMPSSRASCRYLHPVSACSKDRHRQGTVRRYAGGMPAPGCKLGSSYVCLPPFLRRPRRHTVHVVSHPRHQEPPRASTTSQTVG